MELSVIIPTRDRRAILGETLDRLATQHGDVQFEVVIANDGSRDGTSDLVKERQQAQGSYPLTSIELAGVGPAAARNRAIEAARAEACLFIDDDAWPSPTLVQRHAEFHRRQPDPRAALLGLVELAPVPAPTPFMRWLAGLHLDFKGISDPQDAGGSHFYTGNVSVKTSLLRSIGCFDEQLTDGEDIDLGLRLEREGMRLAYDAHAVVEHCSPTDLQTTMARMRSVGRATAVLAERHSGYPVPRRPGLRHRVKAGVLTGIAATGLRPRWVEREIWRFLCHQTAREAFWSGEPPGDRSTTPDGVAPRTGRILARIACRDAAARMPPPSPPWHGP